MKCLTDEQILENKSKFIELLTELDIDISYLVSYLDSERVDFFNKPQNAYNHAYRGALCECSLSMYEEVTKLSNMYFPEKYSKKELIIVSLLREIYRAEMYESYNKNVRNEETGKWETQLSYRVREIRPIFGDVGFSSYMILRKFIDLSNDELVEAICNSSVTSGLDLHEIRRTYPLTSIVSMAEFVINYFKD